MINNNTKRHSTANNNTHEIINSVKQVAENHQSGENNNNININKIDHIETHSSNESTKYGTLNSETNVNERQLYGEINGADNIICEQNPDEQRNKRAKWH